MADNITWSYSPTLATIKLPSGNVYYIKDKELREWADTSEGRLDDLETAIQELSNATHWIGITTTQLTDGTDTDPITIGGESVHPANGDITQDPTGTEFIYTVTGSGSGATKAWQAFGGSTSVFGRMAYCNTATGSGTVSFTPHTKDYALGEATTFTATGGGTAFPNPTTATVLTSSVTATVPKPSYTTKYLTAASGSVSTLGAAMDSTDTEQLNLTTSSTTPTITLTENASSSAGAITYIRSASESGGFTNSVTFDTTTSGTTASAITDLGTATNTQPTITAGTNDKVNAITALGTGTVSVTVSPDPVGT